MRDYTKDNYYSPILNLSQLPSSQAKMSLVRGNMRLTSIYKSRLPSRPKLLFAQKMF